MPRGRFAQISPDGPQEALSGLKIAFKRGGADERREADRKPQTAVSDAPRARGSQTGPDSFSAASPPLLREPVQKDVVDGVHRPALVSPTWPVEARARKPGTQVHKIAPARPPGAPGGSGARPQMPQDGFARPQDRSERLQGAPRRPQSTPREPQDSSRGPRARPVGSHDGPGRPPRRAPRGKNRHIPFGKPTFSAFSGFRLRRVHDGHTSPQDHPKIPP